MDGNKKNKDRKSKNFNPQSNAYVASTFEPKDDKTNKMTCPSSDDRSAWASAQSDHSVRCPHEETLGPKLPN